MVAQTNGNHTSTEVEGRVVRVNDRGLLLAGRSSWLNVSKFAGGVDLPDVGETVRLTLDGSGFIRAIEPAVSDVAPAPAPRQIRPTGGENTASEAPSRDTTITRLAVLKAAAQFCQYRQDVTAEDVLAIAAEFEQWVTR